MHFLYEPRRFWVRPGTHTVVSDRDPDFGYHAASPGGEVRTYLRVWVSRWNGVPRYLGGVWVRARGVSARGWTRLDRRLRRQAGEGAAALRRRLRIQLRQFVRERNP